MTGEKRWSIEEGFPTSSNKRLFGFKKNSLRVTKR
jgi:hypothetical protein